MSLVQSNRKKKSLDRGAPIKPEHIVSFDDVETIENRKESSNFVPDRVTQYANVRIDNHIRNKLEGLVSLGLAKSQKEAVNNAVEYYISSLDTEDRRAFKTVIETLEGRDVRMANGKKR
ncbi:MAG: DUF5388 domain-containing protein [Lentilactobacillus hilgardii]|jgi:Arc/MetJ-type ribon-helix-helix transcriptional regulator